MFIALALSIISISTNNEAISVGALLLSLEFDA